MELLLFDHADDSRPVSVIRIDPTSRTYHYWHNFVPELQSGQIYAYRGEGPFDPENGQRFDPTKVLLDPYGRGVVVPKSYSRDAARNEGDNTATAMKSVVVDPSAYDWEGDKPLNRPSSRTIIYEMHVRGFTRHPSSGVAEDIRGTFKGLVEKIPYLKQLGITAVELLPVFQFDAQDCPPGLVNYWGYALISFFAPHQAYSSRQDPLGPVDEFRDMVKALHRAGIEIILDVVFNHTAEGRHLGPTLSFRGLDNNAYYILEEDRSEYANYSGTGNTLNANHPIVRRLILSLNQLLKRANIAWHGVRLHEPDWRSCSHSLAFSAELGSENLFIHLILNAYWEPLEFELLSVRNSDKEPWRRWIDTSLLSPNDIVDLQDAPSVPGSAYRAEARSVVVLIAELRNRTNLKLISHS